MVGSGREKLQATNLARPDDEAEPELAEADEAFFDQDRG
jgi:hypothetical protein